MSQPHSLQAPVPVILIVEDDPDLLQAIAFSCETEGFIVRAFDSGEALLREPSLPTRGCLVLDQSLPGLDGLAVLRLLRARGVALPAVLITTASHAMVQQAEAAGVPLIEKPLMANALLEEVARQIGPVTPA